IIADRQRRHQCDPSRRERDNCHLQNTVFQFRFWPAKGNQVLARHEETRSLNGGLLRIPNRHWKSTTPGQAQHAMRGTKPAPCPAFLTRVGACSDFVTARRVKLFSTERSRAFDMIPPLFFGGKGCYLREKACARCVRNLASPCGTLKTPARELPTNIAMRNSLFLPAVCPISRRK